MPRHARQGSRVTICRGTYHSKPHGKNPRQDPWQDRRQDTHVAPCSHLVLSPRGGPILFGTLLPPTKCRNNISRPQELPEAYLASCSHRALPRVLPRKLLRDLSRVLQRGPCRGSCRECCRGPCRGASGRHCRGPCRVYCRDIP